MHTKKAIFTETNTSIKKFLLKSQENVEADAQFQNSQKYQSINHFA